MTFNHIVLNIPHSSTIIPVNTWEGDIHINIGFNNDWSRPSDELIQMVIEHFEASAYHVGINTPYSNSITPPSKHPYTSFMIELNKSIYMNELSDMNPHATQLQNTIQQLYPKLLYSS